MNADLLDRLLGQGTFHLVYSLKNNPQQALKIPKRQGYQLRKEAQILSTLSNSNQFPKVIAIGSSIANFQDGCSQERDLGFMVMERLGMSLEEFLRIRRGKISLSMIKDISLQLLRKVVLLHSAGIIHNDIKPSNILFGVGDNRKKIYIIDYGLASLSSSQSSLSPEPEAAYAFRGNLPFASIRKLAGRQPCKSDDIQSIVYVMLWLLSEGHTQWTPIKSCSTDQSCRCEGCNRCLESKMKRYLAAKISFLGKGCSERELNRAEQYKRKLIEFLVVLYQKQQQSQYQTLLRNVEDLMLDVCE